MSDKEKAQTALRESATFDHATMAEIRRAAETGIYDIRGFGAKRWRRTAGRGGRAKLGTP